MFFEFLLLILGFSLLISGADFLVKGSSNIAKTFHIPEILIGLTIVSLGTTLPELIVSIVSASSRNTDIVFSNAIGSNICNLLLILGFITILKPIKFENDTVHKNLPLLLFIITFILIMGIGILPNSNRILTKFNGIILLIIAIYYFAIPIIDFVKEYNIEKNSKAIPNFEYSFVKYIIYILLGGLFLKFGGDFAVNSSVNIANQLGISERIIGLTIVAIGTSLPELITSTVAIIKGNEDIAEGNIIGACIINSSLVLGVGSIISNIPITSKNLEDLILLIICILLIWLFSISNKDNILKRNNGIILVLIYLIFCIRLFI